MLHCKRFFEQGKKRFVVYFRLGFWYVRELFFGKKMNPDERVRWPVRVHCFQIPSVHNFYVQIISLELQFDRQLTERRILYVLLFPPPI